MPYPQSKPDHVIMHKFATKLGFAEQLFKHIKVNGEEPLIEDITREFNKGMWTVGYTGQSPERLKLQAANLHTFNKTTLLAEGGPCDGEYYGLPWPCWGTPEMKHPGTPLLYDTSKSVAKGGLTFRARFGVERDGENLLAEGSYSVGSEIEDGYPEFTADMLKKLASDFDKYKEMAVTNTFNGGHYVVTSTTNGKTGAILSSTATYFGVTRDTSVETLGVWQSAWDTNMFGSFGRLGRILGLVLASILGLEISSCRLAIRECFAR